MLVLVNMISFQKIINLQTRKIPNEKIKSIQKFKANLRKF